MVTLFLLDNTPLSCIIQMVTWLRRFYISRRFRVFKLIFQD